VAEFIEFESIDDWLLIILMINRIEINHKIELCGAVATPIRILWCSVQFFGGVEITFGIFYWLTSVYREPNIWCFRRLRIILYFRAVLTLTKIITQLEAVIWSLTFIFIHLTTAPYLTYRVNHVKTTGSSISVLIWIIVTFHMLGHFWFVLNSNVHSWCA